MSDPATSRATRASVLQRCVIFNGLAADTLSLLAEMMRVEQYAAGETVCATGEVADSVFVIAEGEVAVFLPQQTAPVRHLGPGAIVGEYGMFGERLRTSTVKATRELTLLSLDHERFRQFLLNFPESALRLLEVTVARLVEKDAAQR